jgi:endonuclease/exonuclease/phosphatase family metal-dependent hydrolase
MSKIRNVRQSISVSFMVALALVWSPRAHAAASDIVLYASDATNLNGHWSRTADSSAAGGQAIVSTDTGWASTGSAAPSPTNFFEFKFDAPANTSYHVWLRLRANGNSKYSDSVYAQFSDSVDGNGSAIYRIGTSGGLGVNLQSCNGCALANWGWMDGAYWLSQPTTIAFSTSGTHTLRIQTREDGVALDQVVLSASTYFSSAPGQIMNDATIVPKPATTSPATTTASPYGGSAAAIPGTIKAENFDNGGEGVGYHDTTPGNSGGQYRSTDVDIEASADGGYDIGWAAAGEWLNYTVAVGSTGSYSAQVRVASPSGGSLHVAFGGVSVAVPVPATGGWQTWTNVTAPLTLAAGTQRMTVTFDTGGMNLRYVKVAAATITSAPSTAIGPYSGTAVSLPGKIEAENFDTGGEGVAYHDTTSGNSGGQYRSTDVDIEASSDGGYDIGWTAPGEWLNYSVSVGTAGTYTAQLRVASPTGGAMHLGFNTTSNMWVSVNLPATGGWQTWTTVNVPVTLGAGTQQMTLYFDTGGINLNSVNVTTGSTSTSTSSSSTVGTEVIVAEWNIQVNDSSSAHARTVIDYLAALSPQPQLLVLTEARGTQYNTYLNELQSRTPYTWKGVFLSECPLGAWSGSSCTGSEDEGTAVFTWLPVVGQSTTYLPYADAYHSARALVRLAVSVNGTTMQVMGTHLQAGNATARYNSMTYLKNWASNFPAPQLVAGDFNADPDQIDSSSGMPPKFVDSWRVVNSSKALTCSTPNPTMQLDYWFADSSGRATPNWSSVITSTGAISDHFPLLTSFTVR